MKWLAWIFSRSRPAPAAADGPKIEYAEQKLKATDLDHIERSMAHVSAALRMADAQIEWNDACDATRRVRGLDVSMSKDEWVATQGRVAAAEARRMKAFEELQCAEALYRAARKGVQS